MTKTIYPATLMTDFYKTANLNLFPEGIEAMYGNMTPRSNRYLPHTDRVVVFGIQTFLKKYLIEYFNTHFFNQPLQVVVDQYKRIVKASLSIENPSSAHIEDLHNLGYLPLHIKAVSEGTLLPYKVPALTIENTGGKKFFWLLNYFETLMSTSLWQGMTSATIALSYKELLDKYALKTVGHTNDVLFQGHDFSMRGMSSFESAVYSGMGHLTSFYGTDTIPAISALEEYYGADVKKGIVGASITATEHSIMCAYEQENEFELFKHLITKAKPSGFISIVSDTWDFWKVVGEYIPKLKDVILNRDGRLVIRPDSGDPVKILVGDPNGKTELERKGLVHCLYDIVGGFTNDKGYKVLDDHIGVIYGDAITFERAKAILKQLEAKGFASTNVVFGVGSYTYQMNSRDSQGWAVKATWAKVNGQERFLFKDPKTDDGTKRSLRGRLAVVEHGGEIIAVDGLYEKEEVEGDLLETVFLNGELKKEFTLDQIRETIKDNVKKKKDREALVVAK